MIETTDEQTIFPLNQAQNEGIMCEVERLTKTAGGRKHDNDSQSARASQTTNETPA